MDDPPREWRSPGFGSLAASGFAFGLMVGLVGGVVYGAAVIWGAFLIGLVTGDPDAHLGFLVGWGLFAAIYGAGIGLVVSIVGSLPISLLLAGWLQRSRIQGRPVGWVRGRARFVGAALPAVIAVVLIGATFVGNGWDLGLVVFVVLPSLAAVVAAAVVADQVVRVGARIHERKAEATVVPS